MMFDTKRMIITGLCVLLALMTAHVSLAATINVTTDCELDAAITAANTDSNAHDTDCTAGSGADTIDTTNMSDPTNLGAALPNITSDITISGTGKTLGGSNSYRLFYVASGGKLTLNSLYMTEGSSTGNGGAIYVANGGSLTLNSSFVYNNSSSAFGGGIYSDGSVTINRSAIYQNTSSSSAGGIMADGGTLHISRSAVRNNDSSLGGAGGIFSEAALTIENSTISGNTASGTIGGGGIIVNRGTATITHTTIHENTTGGSGTGLKVESTAGAVSLRNSIISNGGTELDCKLATGVSLAQNIGNVIENGEGNCTTPDTRDDPGLDALTTTDPAFHPLQSTSEAIGAGNAGICKAYSRDQNRIWRPATGCDAGAAERDGYNYIDVSSTCSLSDAFTSANTNVASGGCLSGLGDNIAIDYIRLSEDVALSATLGNLNSTIILDGGGRTVSKDSTAGNFRPFDVFSSGDLTLRNITVWGFSQTSGGAVFNRDTLRLEDCVFVGNVDASGGGGGAIHLGSGQTSTTINRCAFIQNDSVTNSGGAIRSVGGSLTISNSSFIGNTCAGSGCAIYIDGGTVELSHNTYWDNATAGATSIDAVYVAGGSVDVLNSIIGNSAPRTNALCGGGSNNDTLERGIITWNGPDAHGCGTATNANPLLGGRSGFPDYLPLGAGSAAIGKGIASTCARYPIDQRGASRPASGCDVGAVQYIMPPQAEEEEEVRPRQSPTATAVCTGDWLNWNTGIRVRATYGLCSGVQFKRITGAGVGNQSVIDSGFIDGVDVWGYAEQGVEVCFPAYGAMVLLDAATSPRTILPLASYLDEHWTCAEFARPGTAVLINANSPLSSPPASGPAPDALSGCMVTTTYVLNLRAEPNGEIIGMVAHNATLTALARVDGWYQVDANGVTGWISADYVVADGACA